MTVVAKNNNLQHINISSIPCNDPHSFSPPLPPIKAKETKSNLPQKRSKNIPSYTCPANAPSRMSTPHIIQQHGQRNEPRKPKDHSKRLNSKDCIFVCESWEARWGYDEVDECEEGPGQGNGYTPKTGGQPCCLRHQILFAAQEPPWNVTLGCDCGDG